MVSALQFTLFFIVLIAAMLAYNILDFETARMHEQWMAEHGRVYTDKAEKARRLEIFKNNLKHIEDFNRAGKHSYSLGMNQFADLTSEEFMETYKCRMGPTTRQDVEPLGSVLGYNAAEPLESSADDYVDWRSKMTPVKNQGECRSCYIFATVATVETVNYQTHGGELASLSDQQVLDCNRPSGGCDKGTRTEVFKYILKNNGLNTEANYPYTAVQGSCDKAKEKDTKVSIRNYVEVPYESESELKKAVDGRPVTVSIATTEDWQHYTGGIFEETDCPSVAGHSLAVAGYGQEGSKKYWLLRNSWGSSWGIGGYIKVPRDVNDSTGYCHLVYNNPLYPTV